jgi:hypothetical protein
MGEPDNVAVWGLMSTRRRPQAGRADFLLGVLAPLLS